MPVSAAPQSPAMSILLHRPAPALLAIEGHEAVDQRPARQALQVGIERRPHREPAVDAAVADRARSARP
jgi:hypothetical protein